ncbi:MbcA/ParS/Xre antitoxin family protein [Paraburkholderia phenazinium]|uniref:MbcA/ParS/Xre antitoxin family protein n=1 Tax=Paraburkholderia phenazinium TaxID=60549 RepID=UPI00209B7388|nr:MbcA/ParS/Xre antitoxin family protein [Paraburkholderia phenazinium]
MVNQSGSSADFDAQAWLIHWLGSPVPALGGRPPGELLDTAEGVRLVSETLARMQSGAYM